MNISTVNELIQSLESAGELSIREQKFLKLAKAFKQVTAENVALKAGVQAALDEMESHHDTDALYSYDADGEPMDALIRLCDAQGAISDLLSMNETPATDRIVAGIKADGVEEFAAYQRAITDEWACKEGHSSLLKVAESAELFAKQLREGADK